MAWDSRQTNEREHWEEFNGLLRGNKSRLPPGRTRITCEVTDRSKNADRQAHMKLAVAADT